MEGFGGTPSLGLPLTGASLARLAVTPLVWLHGEVKMPPFTREARLECGESICGITPAIIGAEHPSDRRERIDCFVRADRLLCTENPYVN